MLKACKTLFILSLSAVLLSGCAMRSASVYQSTSYAAELYSGQEVITDLGTAPITVNQGKAFVKAGVIDVVVIEGTPSATFGKRSVSFTIHQFTEIGSNCRIQVTGPDCCVKQVDEQNVNFRVSGSLQFFRLSFNPETGIPSLRTLSGDSPTITLRYAVRKLW